MKLWRDCVSYWRKYLLKPWNPGTTGSFGFWWSESRAWDQIFPSRPSLLFHWGFEQIRSQICVCGRSPPLTNKQRARKSLCRSARVPHWHLLPRSGWLLDASVTLSPASRPSALANGRRSRATVNTIRHRSLVMPVMGRNAPVAFTRRVYRSVVAFDWIHSSQRRNQTPSPRTWLVY